MACLDWFISDFTPEDGFLYLSTTINELSYTPSTEERTRDDVQLATTGRRSWKTMKGKGEAVWPPLLEAALLEALEKYSPDCVGTRSRRPLGRFPMRNRFISDYIFEVTGQRRTPKQVGSRLQQLRDTCKGDKLKNLLVLPERFYDNMPSSDDSDLLLSPTIVPHKSNVLSRRPPEPIVVHVRICLQQQQSLNSTTIHLVNTPSTSPQIVRPAASQCTSWQGMPPVIPTSPISVQLPALYALDLQTTFTIYTQMSTTALHTEYGKLSCLTAPAQGMGWSYGILIAPDYWEQLRYSTNLSKYTVVQFLEPVQSPIKVGCETGEARSPITIIYTFAIPPQSCPLRHNLRCATFNGGAADALANSRYALSTYPGSQASSHSSESSHSNGSSQWSTPVSPLAPLPPQASTNHVYSYPQQATSDWNQRQHSWPTSVYPTIDTYSFTNTVIPESDERECKLWPINQTYPDQRRYLPHPTNFYYA